MLTHSPRKPQQPGFVQALDSLKPGARNLTLCAPGEAGTPNTGPVFHLFSHAIGREQDWKQINWHPVGGSFTRYATTLATNFSWKRDINITNGGKEYIVR